MSQAGAGIRLPGSRKLNFCNCDQTLKLSTVRLYSALLRERSDDLHSLISQPVRDHDPPSAASLRGGGCPGMCKALNSAKEAVFTINFKAVASNSVLGSQREGS